MKRLLSLAITAVFFVSSHGFADDSVARTKFAEGKAHYAERAVPARLDSAIAALTAAEAEAQQADLKYEILILASRANQFKAVRTNAAAAKIALLELALKKAEAAQKLNGEWADAYYMRSANMGRLAEAKGPLASLLRKKELLDALETLIDPDTKSKDGQPGEAFESYGGNRILGRLYFRLPSFAGGSQAKSLQYLEVAYNTGKEDSLNVLYYAETLSAGPAANKAKARQILDELLTHDPKTYNRARIPETIEEFADARKLRTQLGQ